MHIHLRRVKHACAHVKADLCIAWFRHSRAGNGANGRGCRHVWLITASRGESAGSLPWMVRAVPRTAVQRSRPFGAPEVEEIAP